MPSILIRSGISWLPSGDDHSPFNRIVHTTIIPANAHLQNYTRLISRMHEAASWIILSHQGLPRTWIKKTPFSVGSKCKKSTIYFPLRELGLSLPAGHGHKIGSI